MMIASILKLSRDDCKALELKDAYSLHKIVYSLFPRQNDADSRDFLFADKGGDWKCRRILIISERRPNVPEVGEMELKEIPDSFLNWDYYGFEVTLNPAIRNGPSRKTIPVRGVDNLREWFIKKAPAFGFEVVPESLQVSNIGVLRFEKKKDGSTFTQTHGRATFIGKLKVINRPEFTKSFKQGIGRAKGFGFGLLQIVPLQK